MKRRLPLMIAGAAALALAARTPLPAVLPVAENSPDGSSRGWKTDRLAPSACETPYRLLGPEVDTTTTAVFLGDTHTAATPGCDPTWIINDFDCGTSKRAGGYCTITFDATLWLAAGERAVVVLAADTNVAAYEIPGARGGRAGRYAAAVAGGGRIRLMYAVWNPSATRTGTRSLLMIDNVESYATTDDITSVSLTPVQMDEIPLNPETIGGHPLPVAAGPEDCNGNGLPDAYEISQKVTPDRDGDGTPDTCQDPRRQIDWAPLALGALVLALVLIWLVRQRQTGNV